MQPQNSPTEVNLVALAYQKKAESNPPHKELWNNCVDFCLSLGQIRTSVLIKVNFLLALLGDFCIFLFHFLVKERLWILKENMSRSQGDPTNPFISNC